MTVAFKLPDQLKMSPVSLETAAVECQRADGKCIYGHSCEQRNECYAINGPLPAPVPVNLKSLESELSRDRLAEIAAAMRALTYGEMMTLAAGLWDSNGKQPLTDDMLPVVLHRWSKGQERK